MTDATPTPAPPATPASSARTAPDGEPRVDSPWWMLWAAPMAAAAGAVVAVGGGLALGADRASCVVAALVAAAPALLSPVVLGYIRGARVTIFGLTVMGLATGRILLSGGIGAGVHHAMGLERGAFLTAFLVVAGATLVGEKVAALAVLRPAAFGQGAQSR